ncbi:MAG: transglutaminase family protein [Cytophagales bacterium]|jgi:regulator of sirC expression with transglutaminase-like and TPR domain|nr:transglutaminase family protein [Cytophagales bacterium]MCA6366738.1 transglutaminase family protein [Cytophagales bacterium]MCA6372751.1 transglutaminase family protein [Cytophagales bacterium]MCA6377607.1 transglutaminase family protein [Cytophagales bacterium]MCA6384774.1 transglutaminase family protein [Cytophagales bacterium]
MQESELKALVSLLDDEDKQVSSHVEEKILSIGKEAIPFLEHEWESNLNPAVQARIEELIHILQYELLKERLKNWYAGEEHDLLTGMWILATYQYPEIELEKLRQDLEQIYYETWLEFRPDLYPYDQVKVINSVLFNKLKFGANTKNFHSPGNSMINVVLESHKGNPITLCVIYMLVAQKLKLPVSGVNLPNLFILTYKDDNHQFYINAFNRGLIFSKQDIENYINELHLVPQTSFYEPCNSIDIVRRVLRNLVMSFEKMGEHAKAEEVKLLLIEISDGGDLGV